MAPVTPGNTPGVLINAAALRRKRQLYGFNQAKLAEVAGVHFSYISRIEAGHCATVGPAVFGRICDALGIEDRTELLDEAGHAA